MVAPKIKLSLVSVDHKAGLFNVDTGRAEILRFRVSNHKPQSERMRSVIPYVNKDLNGVSDSSFAIGIASLFPHKTIRQCALLTLERFRLLERRAIVEPVY